MTLVRNASFEELDARTGYLLWQLRESVFVVEQHCAYAELDGRDLEPGTRHLWVEQAGRPVGYLRVLVDPDGMRLGRVLVAPGHRGRGIAGRLVRAARDVVGDRPCRLDAQAHLVDWYRGQGFETCGAEFLDDGIPHVPMKAVTSG
ncbi:MAG: GNAT family N-acetyltransferase [Nocardioidaceae bacterium]